MIEDKTITQSTHYVSVIVPVYNDKERLLNCIQNLLSQSYPSHKYEIIIVDNGSTDGASEEVASLPVRLINENSIQSSYAARNKGISCANGDIVAFTDSDCSPCQNWIDEGVKSLLENSASLSGGNVRFTFSNKPTGAEVYDSITNMQIKENISNRNVAKTANLFVKTSVFKTIGLFPNEVQSGGDVTWTGKATSYGFKLVYAPLAEVSHPSRKLGNLIKKQYRVGKGQAGMWSDHPKLKLFSNMLNMVSPINGLYIYKKCINHDKRLSFITILRVCIAGIICNSSNLIGNIATLNRAWSNNKQRLSDRS